MIEILGAAGMVAFLVSSLTIGVRLLLLGARTRETPEVALGVAFVVGGVVGYAPETVMLSTDLFSPATEARVLLATQVAIRTAAACVLYFTWRVFRPTQLWAIGLVAVLLSALVVSWIAFPQTRTLATNASDLWWYEVFTVARSACIAWGAVESFLYYKRVKLQWRLGMASPLLVDRFLMWGIGLSSMTVLMATTLLASWMHVDPASSGWVLLESAAGLLGATTLWLTFFPTQAYRRYIERRAGRSESTAA